MARTASKKPKPAEPQCIDVRYDLDELPTAQHKAGLAGLLLQIDSMIERKGVGALRADLPLPEVVERASGGATVRFSEPAIKSLFDDLYAAEVVEAKSASRWQKATLKREEPNPGAKPDEPKRWFVYDVVQPSGLFLRRYTDDIRETWHRLWRDMVWRILRAQPTTRIPFNDRAKGESTKEGADAWRAMVTDERLKGKGARNCVELAGALMLGAQAINAELVRFEDRADLNLLLHFWPLTARVFVPEIIDAEGKLQFTGFVLAVPDIANLVAYCEMYLRFLKKLDTKRHFYRPREAVITLPEQGPLEFMRALEELAAQRTIDERPAENLAGVEFFHAVPGDKKVKLVAHGRIPPESRLLAEYRSLRHHCRNPLLLSCRLLAVLRRKPWFAELSGPLAARPWWFFAHSMQERNRTPSAMVGFAWEIDRKFKEIRDNYIQRLHDDRNHGLEEGNVTELEQEPDAVDRLVYELVRGYVKQRACARKGIKPDDEEWWSKTAEERRDVCSKLFLELRSRNDDDFVRHFTATLGSVPQWLDDEKYLAVAAALMRPYTHDTGENRRRTRDDVKTLTLLALSAHSRSYTPRDDAGDDAATPDEEADR